MGYLAGFAKADITCAKKGVGMMGYGQLHNYVSEVATPLFARVALFQDESGYYFIFVHLEICFVTIAIKEKIVSELQNRYPDLNFDFHNILITAQHTHSAPGGYGHFPFFHLTVPGFQVEVFDTIIAGILNAVSEAKKNIVPVEITIAEHEVHPDKEVAFNRSLASHNQNAEIGPNKITNKALAVNREMIGLNVYTNENKLLAHLNWFGVHATSISSFNTRIHHDNKGVAANLYEKKYPGVIAFFIQACAGDISPNFIWDKQTNLMRGKFKDQYENAEFNGEIQFRESEKIAKGKNLSSLIQTSHAWFDMTQIAAMPAHGLAFFQGTLEGPGIPVAVGNMLKPIMRMIKFTNLWLNPKENKDFYEQQATKDVFFDHRNGRMLGIKLKNLKYLPPLPHKILRNIRNEALKGNLDKLPWVPHILPFQIIRLGEVVIVAIPGEITTQAGRRVVKFIEKNLNANEQYKVIVTSYSNASIGYITTPEEYLTQSYEAGHTVYGIKTLDGVLEGVRQAFEALKEKQ